MSQKEVTRTWDLFAGDDLETVPENCLGEKLGLVSQLVHVKFGHIRHKTDSGHVRFVTRHSIRQISLRFITKQNTQ